MQAFGLDADRKLRTFSKGMKKQVSVICGLCTGADYLFCDETFDGLDPVMRQTVKSLQRMLQNAALRRSWLPITCGSWRISVTMSGCCIKEASCSRGIWMKCGSESINCR